MNALLEYLVVQMELERGHLRQHGDVLVNLAQSRLDARRAAVERIRLLEDVGAVLLHLGDDVEGAGRIQQLLAHMRQAAGHLLNVG